jgi:carbon monoxide dehydrogenase subunit G
VWEALVDVERVAPCLPGAAVTGKNDDGSYNGTFSVKIGPTSASYSGKLEMESVDEDTHTAVMRANGSDKRGQGGAKALITSVLKPLDGGGTRVEVATDYQITGRLARFGRGGMIEDISERLLKEFAKNLQASLAGGGGDGADGGTEAAPPNAEPAPVDPAAAARWASPGSQPDAPAASEDAPAAPPDAAPPAPDEPPPAADAPPPAPEAAPPPPPAPRSGADSLSTSPPPAAANEIKAGPLLASVMRDRIRRNPAPLLGGLLGIVLLRRFRRRRRA